MIYIYELNEWTNDVLKKCVTIQAFINDKLNIETVLEYICNTHVFVYADKKDMGKLNAKRMFGWNCFYKYQSWDRKDFEEIYRTDCKYTTANIRPK